MKRCPECRRDYYDDTLSYCLDDGTPLLDGPASASTALDEPATAILHTTDAVGDAPTRAQIHTTEQTEVLPSGVALPPKNGFDKRLIAVPFLLAIIVLGGFFGYRYFKPAANDQISSIAVLPFQNKSGDANSEYLSDGLAESLIYRLSQLPNLKVSPTSSVIQYKGKDTKVATIASELGVDAVMTGRLAQIGDNLTISVELVDVRNNKLLWGEQYERKMSELLATQREIAAEITNKLKLKLSGESEQKLAKKFTDNNEAYQLYLKGRFSWNKRTVDGLKQAAEYYQKAIEKDPAFALAYAGLAETFVLYSGYSVALPKDSMPQAKAAALKAVELDASLAEAHTALGGYYAGYAWNPEAAERELKRSAELNPNYATAFHWLGNSLQTLGKNDEAIAAARRAEELDPLSAIISADTAFDLFMLRRYDEALAQAQRTVLLDPNFYYSHYLIGKVYNKKGMYKEAVASLRKSVELNSDPIAKGMLVQSLAMSGLRDEAVKLLNELKADSARRYIPGYFLAPAYLALGDRDAAIGLIDKDISERSIYMQWIAVDPELDDLRRDPRFAALVKKVETSKLD